MENDMILLRRIETYLARHDLSATRFGRAALGDPRFVADLRKGRTPRPATIARVCAFLDRAPSCTG
jgi:2,4-dienoyl-CoA reductase-like NADH-dependent reductase (Old Yellow Enzyme family)